VGLTQAMVEDMYKTMALAAYEDRYVIPTTHREVEEDAYALRGSAGFAFREDSGGNSKTNLFGGAKRTPKSPYMDAPT
jgi:nitrate reductase beta subunit